jgi:hypothetical protein
VGLVERREDVRSDILHHLLEHNHQAQCTQQAPPHTLAHTFLDLGEEGKLFVEDSPSVVEDATKRRKNGLRLLQVLCLFRAGKPERQTA